MIKFIDDNFSSKLFILNIQNQEDKKRKTAREIQQNSCLTVIGNQWLEAVGAICSTKGFFLKKFLLVAFRALPFNTA